MILMDLAFQDLERFRHEKKMTIRELVKDITSERMYRRYVRQESRMPLGFYMKLMGRLGQDIIQYTIDLNRRIQDDYPEEHQLVQLIKEERLEEARKLYESHDFSGLRSENRFRFLPILILFMKLRLGWITLKEYMKEANELLDYPKILSYKFLTRVDIEALLVHLLVVEDEDREKIAFFLIRVLEDPSIRVVSHEPDITKSDILNVVSFSLLRKQTLYTMDVAMVRHLLKQFDTYYHPYMELFRLGIHIRNLIELHSITKEEEKKKMDVYHLFLYIFSHDKMTPYLEMLFKTYEPYYSAFLRFNEIVQENSLFNNMMYCNW